MRGEVGDKCLDQRRASRLQKIARRRAERGIIERKADVVAECIERTEWKRGETKDEPLRLGALAFGDADAGEDFELFDVNLIARLVQRKSRFRAQPGYSSASVEKEQTGTERKGAIST